MMKAFFYTLVLSLIIAACAKKERATDTTPRDKIAVGDTVKLNSGVKYVFTKMADEGEFFSPDKLVATHVILQANGNVVWSTYEPLQPFEFIQNEQPMIEGFKEVIQYMREGDRLVAEIPSELGYGKYGNGPDIPPNALLHFDIEILSVE